MANTSIQVVERISRLLDAIVSNGERSTLKVLAADAGLHPSTAFRILHSLANFGFVERDAPGNYRLGRKVLHLSRYVSAGREVDEEAKPVMEWLRDQLGETVNLTLREGDEVVYIGRVLSRRMMRVEQIIGSRAPLHVTAVGKLMLGEEGEGACSAYARRTGLRRLTPNTITDLATLAAAVRRAREEGYAFDDEEAESGVGCIGVPLRDASGRMVAGLSVSAPIERRRAEWVETVLEAGCRISARLGFSCEAEAGPAVAPNGAPERNVP